MPSGAKNHTTVKHLVWFAIFATVLAYNLYTLPTSEGWHLLVRCLAVPVYFALCAMELSDAIVDRMRTKP